MRRLFFTQLVMIRFLPKRIDGIFSRHGAITREVEPLSLPMEEETKKSPLLNESFEEEFTPSDPERSGLRAGAERSGLSGPNKSSALKGGDLTGFTHVQADRVEPSSDMTHAESEVIITDPVGFSSASPASSPGMVRFLWRWMREIPRKFSPFKKSSEGLVDELSSSLAREIQEHRKFRLIAWGVLAGSAFIVVIAIVLTTAFAALTVFVKPRTDMAAIPDMVITLDSNTSRANSAQRILPAERLQFSEHVEGEFQSSGKEYVEERARGKVKLYNQFSSSPQSLVASTRFITDSGMMYRLSRGVTIPGAKIEEGKIIPQSIETELVADKTGDQGNASGEVSLKVVGFKGTPKFDGFYALAQSGFSGGFTGEARVVTRDDLKSAQEKVSKEVYDSLKSAALGKIPPHFKSLDTLREVAVTKVDSPLEKSRADGFRVGVDGTSRVIVFRESDLLTLLYTTLLKEDPTKEILTEGNQVEYQVRSVDFEKGRATLALKGNIKTKAKVPESELVSLLKGKKEGSIIELLKDRPELASFRLTFFPFWLSKAPNSEDKIKLQIVEP